VTAAGDPKRFDVVVVGARCAGSPLATMLARQGLSVCLLDRAQFPSETPSTHMIQPCGVEFLDRLCVLDTISAAGAIPLDRITIVNDLVRIETTADGMFDQPALCMRRVTLDALLVEAAREAGVDVRTGSRVTRLVMDDGRVAGVETEGGPVHARLVVGADGRHSTMASLVGAEEYHVSPPGRIAAWAYFDGVADMEGRARLGRIGELAYLAGPTDGDLYMAALTTSFANQAEFHADRDANFTAGIRAWPELADVVGGGRRVGPIRVLTKWHGYFRQSAGPGWVLVGDAGHFKDPTPGQGISDAFRQAEKLAEAIVDGFGNTDIESATQQWWHWRDKDAYEMYWFARDMGAPGVSSPLNTRMLRDIAVEPEAIRMFLRVLNHEIRPSELMTTPRLLRTAARALLDKPGQIGTTLIEIVTAARLNARRARQRQVLPPGVTSAAWQFQ
jgi:2-polyprenyl-6-methoxyphenol hydroxylase-like FAD-dependent oxidoreductase